MRAHLLPTLVLAACIAALAAWTVALELEVRSVQADLVDADPGLTQVPVKVEPAEPVGDPSV